MKNKLLILSILTFLVSCSIENKKEEQEKTKSILVTNNQNTDSIAIQSTGDQLKDVILILDTIHYGYYNPKPLELCFGKPNEIITDTSEYGEISDTTIGGFYMDTHDYSIYSYNENGMIKEYRYEASVRSDLYHQTKYHYSDKRLDSISTINQMASYRKIIEGKESELKNDGIYAILIHYNDKNELSALEIHDFEKNKVMLYNIVYSK